MSSPRNLVVTGATGKQGGALIQALLSHPTSSSPPFEIYAVTRNPTSASAQALSKHSLIHLIQGDFNSPKEIFSQIPSPWGLFSVTAPEFGKRGASLVEEQQGKAMTQAALEAGVKHIVYTSVDRGANSDDNETPVPHFRSKKLVEDHLKQSAAAKDATWTILRPVAFMDNVSRDFVGKVFMEMWKQNGLDTRLQMVSTKDIGRVGAEALLNAEMEGFRNKAITLAGDEVSPNEATRVFKEVTGEEIPSTWGFLGTGMKWMMKDELGGMFRWFKEEGYAADVEGLRERFGFMKDFGQWVKEESAWRRA